MTQPAAEIQADDVLYTQTMAELRSPRPASMTSLLFIVLLLVFVVGLFGDLMSVSGVLMLVAVVVVHEAGHALGMRLFGFRDVKMFFIPFFGAAVSGRPRGVAAWKEAMVSLLGPLPGIFASVGLLVYAITRPHPSALPFHVVQATLVLNAFNLLPFGFLDGGRFLGRVVFSRHRVLDVGFQAVGSLLLVVLSFLGSMQVLGAFALLSLFTLPARWRTLTAATALRKQLPSIVPDPDQLGGAEARTVFAAARAVVQYPASEDSSKVALEMESLLGAMKRAPGVAASIGLLSVYGLGLVCSVFGLVGLVIFAGPVEWRTVEQPGWRAEFPSRPLPSTNPATPPGGPVVTEWHAVIEGTERFTISVADSGGDDQWLAATAARVAKATATKAGQSRPIELAGHRGVEVELSAPNRVVRARAVVAGRRRYEAIASAPRWGDNQRRFLESFTIVDSLARPSTARRP